MSILSDWNTIKMIEAFPCAKPNPIILIGTFIPAVTPALFEWVTFGCRDLLKFRLGKGTPCGRMMKAQVAKAIPPAFVDTVAQVLKWEHRFSFAGQMFLLADLAADTVARWTTLAYQMSGCPDALDYASWDIEFQAPEALGPNVPTAIGGRIVNGNNTIGKAWPTGAIVPPRWYLSAHFKVEAKTFHGGDSCELTTWLRREDHGGFDYPGNKYPKGYPNEKTTGTITQTVQNSDEHHSSQYTMMAMADRLSLTTDVKGTFQVSQFPPSDYTISALSCINSIGVEHVQDPAGRNPKTRYPGIIGKFVGANAPRPIRGSPGGMPRSKK
jgi:hypothetical protein